VRQLVSQLGALRRSQTPADRTYPTYLAHLDRNGPFVLVAGLTRLAATTVAPGVGSIRVYVTVVNRRPIQINTAQQPAAPEVQATAVSARGRRYRVTRPLSAAALQPSGVVGFGLNVPSVGSDPNVGLTFGVVPDRVKRVEWIFSGARLGLLNPHPVTVYPQLRENVALAPIESGEGPLVRAIWYGADGRVIASSAADGLEQQQLRRINSINASRGRPIAPALLAHYELFRSFPADDPTTDPAVPTPGIDGGYSGELGLNYWQTRYIPTSNSLDGAGLWITPGTRGLCISSPQVTSCGMLKDGLKPTGFIGPIGISAHRTTISGLVPDRNPTITIVFSNGTRKTIPVIHNVYQATLAGHPIAIIDRNTTGHIQRESLN
jgi:hypothetical protein